MVSLAAAVGVARYALTLDVPCPATGMALAEFKYGKTAAPALVKSHIERTRGGIIGAAIGWSQVPI